MLCDCDLDSPEFFLVVDFVRRKSREVKGPPWIFELKVESAEFWVRAVHTSQSRHGHPSPINQNPRECYS